MADGGAIEQRGASARVTESRERIPVNPLRVGVSLSTRFGGYGDISHGLKIVSSLAESPKFNTSIYVPPDTHLPTVPYPKNIKSVTYEREERNHIRSFVSSTTEDVMISVCGAPIPITLGDPIRIYIEEFGVPVDEVGSLNGRFSRGAKEIDISTGFHFNPNIRDTIQSGITNSAEYERILQKAEKDPRELLSSSEQVLSDITRNQIILEGTDIGMFYTSSLANNFAYFDLLRLAQGKLRRPVTIIAPVTNNEVQKKEDMLKEKIAALGFNYVSPDGQTQNDSTVTVVNPRNIPYDTFLSLQAVTNLPYVMTGDQSLAEAIQKSASGVASPLLYYCPFIPKQDHFITHMEKIDPVIAQQLGNYFTLEAPAGVPLSDGESPNKRKNYDAGSEAQEKVASLFYDFDAINRYTGALRNIRPQMIRDRQGYVDDPETLVDVGKTTETILDAIQHNEREDIRRLIVK